MQMRQTQPLLISQGQVPHLSLTMHLHSRHIFFISPAAVRASRSTLTNLPASDSDRFALSC